MASGAQCRGNAAVLLAAGSGSRMRGSVKDKILVPLCGQPAICHSFAAFVRTGVFQQCVIVCRDDEQQRSLRQAIDSVDGGGLEIVWVAGGGERQDSVLNGVVATSAAISTVFIHDCARPLIRAESILLLHQAVRRHGAAVLAHRVADTIKRIDQSVELGNAVELKDLDRSRLWAMETPQAFERELILSAYRAVAGVGGTVTDDTAAVASLGRKVEVVENLSPNPKLTTADDIATIEFLLAARERTR